MPWPWHNPGDTYWMPPKGTGAKPLVVWCCSAPELSRSAAVAGQRHPRAGTAPGHSSRKQGHPGRRDCCKL